MVIPILYIMNNLSFYHVLFLVHSGVFSIGIKHEYWSKYKTAKDGKAVNEHYVDKKYHDFKEEIYNYHHLNIKQFRDEILVKANQYINTNMVKYMRISTEKHNDEFGIAEGTKISKDNLVAILLYTDYTELSGDFTSTFRKHSPFESLSAVKARNQKYWWWSKILLETVQIYGDEHSPRFKRARISIAVREVSTFYSGMSIVLHMPQFNILLLSPTSTSIHIEVAMKFSGQSGIIIEFKTDQVGQLTKSFNVSWLSRYPEEEERYITTIYV